MPDKGIDIATVKAGMRKFTEGVGKSTLKAHAASKAGAGKLAELSSTFVQKSRPEATVLGGALVNNGLRAAMGLPIDKASMASAAGAAVQAAMGGAPEPPHVVVEDPPTANHTRPPAKEAIDVEFTVVDEEQSP